MTSPPLTPTNKLASETRGSEGLLTPALNPRSMPWCGVGAGLSLGGFPSLLGSLPPEGQALGSKLSATQEGQAAPHLLASQGCLSPQTRGHPLSATANHSSCSRTPPKDFPTLWALQLGIRGRTCSQGLLIRALPFSDARRQPSLARPLLFLPDLPSTRGHVSCQAPRRKSFRPA